MIQAVVSSPEISKIQWNKSNSPRNSLYSKFKSFRFMDKSTVKLLEFEECIDGTILPSS